MRLGKAAMVVVCLLGLSCTTLHAEACSRDEMVQGVQYAANLIESQGVKAFEELLAYRFCGGGGYIYITDLEAVMLLNGAIPALQGQSCLSMQDAKGNSFAREVKEKAERQASGWQVYWMTNPLTKQVEPKCTYFEKARMDGREVIVCGTVFGIAQADCR